MDAQLLKEDKLVIISWISGLQDEAIINKIKSLMKNAENTPITSEQKLAIDEALDDIEQSGVKSHESVMKETKSRYPHLFAK